MVSDILAQVLGKVHTRPDEGKARSQFDQDGQIGRRFRSPEGLRPGLSKSQFVGIDELDGCFLPPERDKGIKSGDGLGYFPI
jgi:hypothetical protein